MRPKNKEKDRRNIKAFQKIEVPEGTSIAVVGDIHEHSEQYFKLLKEWKPSETKWIVSVGDVYDKGFGIREAEKITDSLIELQEDGIGFAVRGNHELKQIRKNKNQLSPQLKWWRDQPLILSFEFSRGKSVTVLHAGVTPKMQSADLGNQIEVCYVRDIDDEGKMIPLIWKMIDGENTLVKKKEGGVNWHEQYDGRFGFIASGHSAQTDGVAKTFNYSMNLDTACYDTGILTAQEFLPNGSLGRMISIKGTAAAPELKVGY